MHCTRKVLGKLFWVGSNDRRLSLFENIIPIPRGVSYNSYLLLDEKTVLFDTIDLSCSKQLLGNIEYLLGERPLDYLIINHMEPDHCSNIEELSKRYPNMKVVGNIKTIQMIKQFFDFDIDSKSIIVKEGDELCVGESTLQFYMAPMVHWPEVMVTYDKTNKVLFSADAFGSFGALNGNIFADEINFEKDWLDDARRYYSNIVGKYGVQVQGLLKKISNLEISVLCPLHGPIWNENIEYIVNKHKLWSSYQYEEKGIMIVYASMYGGTENAVNVLANSLAEKEVKNIAMYDVSNIDVSYLISEAFRYSHIVLASPTYNGRIYPKMENLINDMKALNVQNKTVAVIENGTWALAAGKHMIEILSEMKNINIINKVISIKSTLKKDGMKDILELRDEILESLK